MPASPNLDLELLPPIDPALYVAPGGPCHGPRILILYGSLRERSYSRFIAEEAARLLKHLGAEVRLSDPAGLPLPDAAPVDHLKVAELRELVASPRTWCGRVRSGTAR